VRRKLLKDSSKIMLVLLLITILVMISEKPVYAHLSSIQPSSGCFSQIVTLNGKMPATSRCVVKKPLLTKGGGQLAVLSSNILIQQHCGEYVINALILFRDSNFSGDSICFKEHGTAQLSDWRMSDGTSWNDPSE